MKTRSTRIQLIFKNQFTELRLKVLFFNEKLLNSEGTPLPRVVLPTYNLQTSFYTVLRFYLSVSL